MRNGLFALVLALAWAGAVMGQQAPSSPAPQQTEKASQESSSSSSRETAEPAGEEETVRVRHRVVFLDALVRDRRTNAPVSDLGEENFEVVADGRPRKLTYFTREGDAGRKPLALTLVLDLRRSGAGRYLRRPDIMQAMAAELAKLPARDEVAVVVLNAGQGGPRLWLTPHTRDRARTAAALAKVPSLVTDENSPVSVTSGHDSDVEERGPTISATFGGDEERKKELEAAAGAGGPRIISVKEGEPGSDIESEIKMVGKDGSVMTRTVYKDGRIGITRTAKNGEVTTDIAPSYDVVGAIHEALRVSRRDLPDARPALVWISDGIVPVFYIERDLAVAELTLSDATFNALVTDMKFGFKLFKPVLKPLGNAVGLGIYGTSQHVARETGGEAVRVNRPGDYANGLARIIGNLTGRYSLGFTLADDEQDDGRMHELEVRARARDAKGKERKLTVVTRRGFYLPRTERQAPPPPVAEKQ